MRFALKKTVPFTNLGRKSDKYKNRARDMIEKIAFHMLHVPSKPPQFWSADFLQNYPLFTSNAGLNLIEGPSNKTLVSFARVESVCTFQEILASSKRHFHTAM